LSCLESHNTTSAVLIATHDNKKRGMQYLALQQCLGGRFICCAGAIVIVIDVKCHCRKKLKKIATLLLTRMKLSSDVSVMCQSCVWKRSEWSKETVHYSIIISKAGCNF
jgi:hypothetical protein